MTTILLAPVLDLGSAAGLKQDLLEAFVDGSDVTIAADQVQRASSPCLQLLAAAVVRGACLSNPSAALCETAGALDLVQALKLAPQEPEIPHV